MLTSVTSYTYTNEGDFVCMLVTYKHGTLTHSKIDRFEGGIWD